MKATTPREMTAAIDAAGNAIAHLLSDRTTLQNARELFSGTVVGVVANVLAGQPNGNFDSFATIIKACIVNECLRAVQSAIYADGVVEESELDHAYPIVKPLVSFYQRHVGGRYSRFDNLQRSNVFDFLHTHMTDPDFFGGTIQQTKQYYEGKHFTPQELLTLQSEHAGGCLTGMATIFMGDHEAFGFYFYLVHYPFFFILSNGKICSWQENAERHFKQTEIDSYHSFRGSKFTATTSIAKEYDKLLQTHNLSAKLEFLEKSAHIMNWWKQNKSRIPTVSHFAVSWYVGSDFVPASPTSNQVPSPGVVPISIQEPKTPDDILKEAMDELNALEGLPSVKKEVGNLVAFLKIRDKRAKHGMKGASNQALHYVFSGNPGTGKTTVARILARVFYGFGILKTQKVIETDRSGLVAGFVGQTAIKTDEVIQNSLDGVLLIDEAYALAKSEGGQDFGQEAIDTLLKRMEDHRDRLIVILAGYPALMRQFLQSNPGLTSRFTRSITFEDYTVPEMCRIFANMCKKEEYTLSKEALAHVSILFSLAHSQKDEHFGNARFVRNIYENTTMKQSARLAAECQVTKEALATLEHCDVPFEMIPNFDVNSRDLLQSRWSGTCPGCQKHFESELDSIAQRIECECGESFEFPWWNPIPATTGGISPDDTLKEAMVELEALEGLPSVKKEVADLVAFLKVQQQRAQHGMRGSNQALHYVFSGNPGTGKTTVARILAKVFYGFGILKTPKVTETDRSGLVAGFVGQTAIKTDEVIQSSLDGVLLIDEAYTLAKSGGGQDFGQEAIDTLLKRMEDHRDRLIVIVAGYPALMQQFIRSNPGLSSRFTRSITFEDYTVPEMCRIFANMCQKEEYTLTSEALAHSCILFALALSQKDEHFGNGRFVRNIYENTTIKQSARLAAEYQVTKEALSMLQYCDVPFEMIPNFDVNALDLSQSRWSGTCPSCQKSINAKLDFIGQQVTCKECGEKFQFPWWNPLLASIGGIPSLSSEH